MKLNRKLMDQQYQSMYDEDKRRELKDMDKHYAVRKTVQRYFGKMLNDLTVNELIEFEEQYKELIKKAHHYMVDDPAKDFDDDKFDEWYKEHKDIDDMYNEWPWNALK